MTDYSPGALEDLKKKIAHRRSSGSCTTSRPGGTATPRTASTAPAGRAGCRRSTVRPARSGSSGSLRASACRPARPRGEGGRRRDQRGGAELTTSTRSTPGPTSTSRGSTASRTPSRAGRASLSPRTSPGRSRASARRSPALTPLPTVVGRQRRRGRLRHDLHRGRARHRAGHHGRLHRRLGTPGRPGPAHLRLPAGLRARPHPRDHGQPGPGRRRARPGPAGRAAGLGGARARTSWRSPTGPPTASGPAGRAATPSTSRSSRPSPTSSASSCRAQLKPVLEAGKAALNIVDVLMPEDTPGDSSVELSGYTPDEVYNSLVEIIGKLEQRVFDQEWELAYSTLSGLLDYMHGHDASQFHIHPDQGIDPDLVHAPQLTVHPEVLRKIGYQLSPAHRGLHGSRGRGRPGGRQARRSGRAPTTSGSAPTVPTRSGRRCSASSTPSPPAPARSWSRRAGCSPWGPASPRTPTVTSQHRAEGCRGRPRPRQHRVGQRAARRTPTRSATAWARLTARRRVG